MTPEAARILAVLPQTQCTRCGYVDCAAYACAIAEAKAPINQCPPGGQEGIYRLAQITGQSALPLNPHNGQEGPRSVAVVDEDWCIGCTHCIDVCPVDAIVGASKRMHTVLEAYCTGCELCLPVCPVDCIVLENVSGEETGWNAWGSSLARQAQDRYTARQQRLSKKSSQATASAANRARLPQAQSAKDPKKAMIDAAVSRARARQSAR